MDWLQRITIPSWVILVAWGWSLWMLSRTRALRDAIKTTFSNMDRWLRPVRIM